MRMVENVSRRTSSKVIVTGPARVLVVFVFFMMFSFSVDTYNMGIVELNVNPSYEKKSFFLSKKPLYINRLRAPGGELTP